MSCCLIYNMYYDQISLVDFTVPLLSRFRIRVFRSAYRSVVLSEGNE